MKSEWVCRECGGASPTDPPPDTCAACEWNRRACLPLHTALALRGRTYGEDAPLGRTVVRSMKHKQWIGGSAFRTRIPAPDEFKPRLRNPR